MGFGDDERAVAIQVGASILLTFVVLTMAIYQAQVVPDQNRDVEFNHNQDVQSDLQDARSAVVSMPGSGQRQSVTVQLGTTYPSRSLFVNPPQPAGRLRTTDPGSLRIANAVADDDEVEDFWDGSTVSYSTRAIEYRPDYHEYTEAPDTVFENTVLANFHRSAETVSSDQALVDGRTITVVTVNGTYQEASTRAVSMDLWAASASPNTVTVSNSTDPVTLTVPTQLSNATWSSLLEDEYVGNGGHVVHHNVSSVRGSDYEQLTIELEAGVNYELQMARVGVGKNVADQEGTYITAVEGDGATISTGENHTLVAQVLDKYNNPVSGVPVNATVVSGPGSVEPATDDTNADGQAEFVFNAPSTGTATIRANFSKDPGQAETVNFTVYVTSGDEINVPPVASLTYSPSNPDTGDTVTFDASASYDPDGNITSYAWDFDDDGTVDNTTTSAVVDHSYADAGTYDATVTVVDDNGTTDSDNVTITVTPPSGQNIRLVSGSVSGDSFSFGPPRLNEGSLKFDIKNTGGKPANIVGIKVNEAGAATKFESDFPAGCQFGAGKDDLYVDSSVEGCADKTSPTQYTIGQKYPMTVDASINPGTTATLYFYQFRDDNDDPVSVSGETVEVVLYFEDGSSKTLTISVP